MSMIEMVITLALFVATVVVDPWEVLGQLLNESQSWNDALIVSNFYHFVRQEAVRHRQ